MFVFICNRIYAKLVDSSRSRSFWTGTQIWRFLDIDSRNLNCYNLRLLLKNLDANCLGFYSAILTQFTLEMYIAA